MNAKSFNTCCSSLDIITHTGQTADRGVEWGGVIGGGAVRPDWAIFESSWQQFFFKKLPKNSVAI